MPGSAFSSGTVVEVLWDLALAAGAGEEGIFVVKAFMVLRKIPVPRPGSQEAAQGTPGQR